MTRAVFCITTHNYDTSIAILDLDPDFLCNFVNSSHNDVYDTSKESCAQGLYFLFTPKTFELFMGTL